MITWSDADEAVLAELLARKEQAREAKRDVAAEIVGLVTDDLGYPTAAWGPVQVARILELLQPTAEVEVVDYQYSRPASEPANVTWLRGDDAPNHEGAGCRRAVARMKRMGPESGNLGYWFVDPQAYSIGPFQNVEEREIYIRRMFLEGPEDVLTDSPTIHAPFQKLLEPAWGDGYQRWRHEPKGRNANFWFVTPDGGQSVSYSTRAERDEAIRHRISTVDATRAATVRNPDWAPPPEAPFTNTERYEK